MQRRTHTGRHHCGAGEMTRADEKQSVQYDVRVYANGSVTGSLILNRPLERVADVLLHGPRDPRWCLTVGTKRGVVTITFWLRAMDTPSTVSAAIVHGRVIPMNPVAGGRFTPTAQSA